MDPVSNPFAPGAGTPPQRRLPVMLVSAGLPQLGRMGQAKSYAERLFDFSEIGALAELAANWRQ
jgi:hypothetical protein